MSYCSITNADVFALTRQRRSERRESRRQAYIAIYGPTRYFCPSPLAEPLKARGSPGSPTEGAGRLLLPVRWALRFRGWRTDRRSRSAAFVWRRPRAQYPDGLFSVQSGES